MSEVDEFIADLADSVSHIRATSRQKEIFKASLRYAIAYARRKADERKTGICACAAMGKKNIPHARNCPAVSLHVRSEEQP
jgi:hypothetical protein